MAKPAPTFDPYLLFARTGASKTTERVSKMADYVDSETGARGLQTTAPTHDGWSNMTKSPSIYATAAEPGDCDGGEQFRKMTRTPASRRISNRNEGSAVNSLYSALGMGLG